MNCTPAELYAHHARCRRTLTANAYAILLLVATEPQRAWNATAIVGSLEGILRGTRNVTNYWKRDAERLQIGGLVTLTHEPSWKGGTRVQITGNGLVFLGFIEVAAILTREVAR